MARGRQADLASVAVEPVPHVMTGKQPGNAYDEEVKKEILTQAMQEGKSIALLVKENGISKETISRWIHELEDEIQVESRALDAYMVRVLGTKTKELLAALTTEKLAKASARDIAIAAGILTDKRRDLLGPVHKDDAINLRIAWKDGSGAVELSTGRKSGGKRT